MEFVAITAAMQAHLQAMYALELIVIGELCDILLPGS